MSRRAQKRQSLIVSLSDQNSLELQQIESERTIIMKEFEEKKAGIAILFYVVFTMHRCKLFHFQCSMVFCWKKRVN